jgi:hypothetical protein
VQTEFNAPLKLSVPFFALLKKKSSPMWPNKGFRCRLFLTLRTTLICSKVFRLLIHNFQECTFCNPLCRP